MSKSVSRIPTAIFVCLVTPLVGICLACGSSDPGSDDVRDALGGSRYVAPALADLPIEHDCTFSDDFLPVIRCGEPSEEQRLLRLDRDLAARISAEPTDDQLRAKALVRLAPGPKARDEAGRAVTYLEEALQDEEDPQKRARLLADLSGAYLLWAEETQSPIEVVAGLEAALEAEELVPGLEDAVFNRRLASVLLGVDHAGDVEGEPLLHDLANLLADRADQMVRPNCGPLSEFRQAVDKWSRKLDEAHRLAVLDAAACWLGEDDRFASDLVTAIESGGPAVADAWMVIREVEKGLSRGVPPAALRSFEQLVSIESPPPLQVYTDHLRAVLAYREGEMVDAETQLAEQVGDSIRHSYSHWAARGLRVMALISGLRADYGQAMERNRQAEAWALRSGSFGDLAAVLEQRIELLLRTGAEVQSWRTFATVHRVLDANPHAWVRGRAFLSGVLLARERNFERVAKRFADLYVAGMQESGPEIRIWAHLNRAEWAIDAGRRAEAVVDVATGLDLFEVNRSSFPSPEWVEAEIQRVRGRLVADPRERRRLLSQALPVHRRIGYDYRVLSTMLELARVERVLGKPRIAIDILRVSLEELEEQVWDAESWVAGTALVESARPLVDELVGLLLDHGRAPDDVAEAIGRYLALRSNRPRVPIANYAEDRFRWTPFVRADEVVHVLESSAGIEVVRQPAVRSELQDARFLLLEQLELEGPEARIRSTLDLFASVLVEPVRDQLLDARSLVVVADDVLAGLPFGLLPLASAPLALSEAELLIDRWAVSYSSDHGTTFGWSAPDRVLAVGATGGLSGLPPLRFAGREAEEVSAIYPASTILTGQRAVRESLLTSIRESREEGTHRLAVHIASHFRANLRSPLESVLILEGSDASQNRISLGELLISTSDGLELLYLSACDTGRGLPPSAHGFHSLAQALQSSGVGATVTNLWPVNDEVAGDLASSFHREVLRGSPPEVALRDAKLRIRDSHPSRWAAVTLYH